MRESEATYRLRADRVLFTEAEGEIVVLDIEQSLYLSMSPTAAQLWRRLARGATGSELRDELLAQFEVTEDIAERDSRSFLADLEERGFVERSPAGQ